MKTVRQIRVVRKPLSVGSVEKYMLNTGWRNAEYQGPNKNMNVRMFSGPDDIYGKPIKIALPARDDLLDAKQRVKEIVRTLAIVGAKTQAQVMKEIDNLAQEEGAGQARTLSIKPRRVSLTEVGK